MATYNWSYKPGVPNKYNLTIPNTLDSVRPTGFVYVSLSGNDVSGNGSRTYPFKTVVKAAAFIVATEPNSPQTIIVSSGVYREVNIANQSNNTNLIGDGNVTFDGTGNSSNILVQGKIFFKNCNLFNYFRLDDLNVNNYTDCVIKNISVEERSDYYLNLGDGNNNNVIVNARVRTTVGGNIKNNTFINCKIYFNLPLYNQDIPNLPYSFIHAIFYNSKIYLYGRGGYFDYCLMYNTEYFMYTIDSFDVSVDASTVLINSLTTLNNKAAGINYKFRNCIINNPKFNNPDFDDYTLAFDSPAKNVSYLGTYVGAKSIAYSIIPRANAQLSDFDNESAINLNVTDNSITFIDSNLNGQIDTKVKNNQLNRQYVNFIFNGLNADRNGEYVDSLGDLSTILISQGTALKAVTPYLVVNAGVSYGGFEYTAGEKFTTQNNTSSFTTQDGGQLREITEAPQRHTILLRFSNGNPTVITAGTTLTTNSWYVVPANKSVIYNSIAYSNGTVFKAIAGQVHSGDDIQLAMPFDAQYNHYELNSLITSNNQSDSRNGVILRGNGEPTFERGALNIKEFPINQKFIQARTIYQHDNLKP